jgi:hypothetical protein
MRSLAAAVLLLCTCLSTTPTTQSPTLPICVGGPFQGPTSPTYPPTPGDPRNCRAIPTQVTPADGRGPLPAPGTFGVQSAGNHQAGSQTVSAIYTALQGVLQVQNPDLSQSGPNAQVLNTYLFTPDFSRRLQTGWIEEAFQDTRRVFVESNVGFTGRRYFDQYPLVDGVQYRFAVVSKPAGWYTLLWWNSSWQETWQLPGESPREGVLQQFLEVYTDNGVHPHVEPTYNDESELVWQDTSVRWDTLVNTSTAADAPYEVNWIQPYYHWAPGCWGAC